MKNDFVQVNSYWFPEEANLARIYLESNGIPCSLEGAELVRMAWLDANAIGGVKLLVQESDAEHARDLLQNRPEVDEDGLESESITHAIDFESSDASDDSSATEQHLFKNLHTLKPFVVFLFLVTPVVALLTFVATPLAMLLNIRVFS